MIFIIESNSIHFHRFYKSFKSLREFKLELSLTILDGISIIHRIAKYRKIEEEKLSQTLIKAMMVKYKDVICKKEKSINTENFRSLTQQT